MEVLILAETAVALQDFRENRLPPVCVRTGRPSSTTIRITYDSIPGWTAVLLPFGVLAALLAATFSQVRVGGALPMSRSVTRRWQWLTRLRRISGWLTVSLFVVGGIAASEALLWACIAALVVFVLSGAVVLLIVPPGRPDTDSGILKLKRVHPAFAAAVEGRSRAQLFGGP